MAVLHIHQCSFGTAHSFVKLQNIVLAFVLLLLGQVQNGCTLSPLFGFLSLSHIFGLFKFWMGTNWSACIRGFFCSLDETMLPLCVHWLVTARVHVITLMSTRACDIHRVLVTERVIKVKLKDSKLQVAERDQESGSVGFGCRWFLARAGMSLESDVFGLCRRWGSRVLSLSATEGRFTSYVWGHVSTMQEPFLICASRLK